MPKITFLGTAYSIPDERHGNTQLVIQGGDRTVLVDASGDVFVRLEKAGIDPLHVTDLVLTHFHPDHVSGLPLLLMDMWLMKRRQPLQIYGLAYTIDRVEAMMQLFEWRTWENIFPVTFHRIPDLEGTVFYQSPGLQLTSSPTRHFIPSIGMRIEFPETGTKLAYSADTAPCPQMVSLARDVSILIHESTGASAGHSSPEQAGEIAQAAGAQCLYLIHYPARETQPEKLISAAQSTFSGRIVLAEDYRSIEFSLPVE